MKNLMMAALLIVGTTVLAQANDQKQGRREQGERLNSEQRNQLQLKKMTLDLGLNDSQQKEMSKIIAEQTAKREAAMADRKANKEKGIKLTADQRFAKENQMLDERIAMKARVKKILTNDQFEKWEAQNQHKKSKMKRRIQHKSEKKQQKINE